MYRLLRSVRESVTLRRIGEEKMKKHIIIAIIAFILGAACGIVGTVLVEKQDVQKEVTMETATDTDATETDATITDATETDVTEEVTTSEERQNSFTAMMKVALDTATTF